LRELVASTRSLTGTGGAELPGARADQLARDLEQTIAILARERARFRAVLEGMSDAVIALDADDLITLMNPAARSLLGAEADPLGRSLIEIVRAPALQDLLAQTGADAADAPGQARTSEFDLPGGQRRVLASVTVEPTSGGRVLVLHDVTKMRRLETVRRDFVANVSHELRTPISIVSANAETLLHGALEDRAGAVVMVEAIYRNADRLRHLIDDLLDLSRLEAGKLELAIATTEIGPLVGRVREAVIAKAEARGTRIRVEIPEGLGVQADAGALFQVLVNLLDNAIKYGQEGGDVVVVAARTGDRVRLEVRDDGPGIAPTHRERIFERFYRIDPGRSRDMGGTGLGLSIVKHLLEGMDGRIGVASNHPRGSIFWIDLPALPAPA
jgi:two-component system phosphate regulon sensor histidine kinase PhoR